MNNLNTIYLEGNLVRDPEAKETPKGTPVVEFSLASNRYYYHEEKVQKEVSFFDIEVWDKTADRCAKLEKGQGVRVYGRLKQDRWVDKEGRNRSKIRIVGEKVEIRPRFQQKAKDEATKGGNSPLVPPF